ncbi:Heavy metal transport/detoxification protein [Methanosalsum zhilinae DSM 4017]|uniref:Heavy metal transport/detoxification protein n=1 Tax=Methanosalsum zhilinae (strain DSM 4017 / NBRC 107636 / OCM 62 / WeN5) TaxID=679901 RepID=F7XQ86_METZD|nr:cation transporter [Methanosalsum zhilinae]AEH61548.1 Heavy metal transport/detoxification protein [Methanosalsum zhilinae DSM 4017]
MKNIMINVRGMTCQHCKMAVEKALMSTEGVHGVSVDLDKGTVSVEYDDQRTDPEKIRASIVSAGYDPQS